MAEDRLIACDMKIWHGLLCTVGRLLRHAATLNSSALHVCARLLDMLSEEEAGLLQGRRGREQGATCWT